MVQWLLETFEYYWPRFIVSAWFAITNSAIVAKRFGKKHFLRNLFVMLILAYTTIAVITESVSSSAYQNIFRPMMEVTSQDNATLGYLLFFMTLDAVSVILPTYIFSRLIHEKWKVGATIYLMYVIVDRVCILLAVSAMSYFITFVVLLTIGMIFFSRRLEYIVENAAQIEWTPVIHYQVGMFFLLDALQGVFFVFPGINNGVADLKNYWLDAVALVSFAFFAGFARLNVRASREQAEKMRYMKELQDSERDIIQKFAEISEAKSGETGQHVKRVAEYSRILARGYGLTEAQIEHIGIASMMHDIGKLLVPREIIEKPGVLSNEEMEIMKYHTKYGQEILANSRGEEIVMSRIIAFQHHERWDGRGYPSGLSGEQISVYAQIVSVADVFDALTSKRSYKQPWSCDEAKKEIISQRGKQFAPRVVDAFVRCYDEILEVKNKYKDE